MPKRRRQQQQQQQVHNKSTSIVVKNNPKIPNQKHDNEYDENDNLIDDKQNVNNNNNKNTTTTGASSNNNNSKKKNQKQNITTTTTTEKINKKNNNANINRNPKWLILNNTIPPIPTTTTTTKINMNENNTNTTIRTGQRLQYLLKQIEKCKKQSNNNSNNTINKNKNDENKDDNDKDEDDYDISSTNDYDISTTNDNDTSLDILCIEVVTILHNLSTIYQRKRLVDSDNTSNNNDVAKCILASLSSSVVSVATPSSMANNSNTNSNKRNKKNRHHNNNTLTGSIDKNEITSLMLLMSEENGSNNNDIDKTITNITSSSVSIATAIDIKLILSSIVRIFDTTIIIPTTNTTTSSNTTTGDTSTSIQDYDTTYVQQLSILGLGADIITACIHSRNESLAFSSYNNSTTTTSMLLHDAAEYELLAVYGKTMVSYIVRRLREIIYSLKNNNNNSSTMDHANSNSTDDLLFKFSLSDCNTTNNESIVYYQYTTIVSCIRTIISFVYLFTNKLSRSYTIINHLYELCWDILLYTTTTTNNNNNNNNVSPTIIQQQQQQQQQQPTTKRLQTVQVLVRDVIGQLLASLPYTGCTGTICSNTTGRTVSNGIQQQEQQQQQQRQQQLQQQQQRTSNEIWNETFDDCVTFMITIIDKVILAKSSKSVKKRSRYNTPSPSNNNGTTTTTTTITQPEDKNTNSLTIIQTVQQLWLNEFEKLSTQSIGNNNDSNHNNNTKCREIFLQAMYGISTIINCLLQRDTTSSSSAPTLVHCEINLDRYLSLIDTLISYANTAESIYYNTKSRLRYDIVGDGTYESGKALICTNDLVQYIAIPMRECGIQLLHTLLQCVGRISLLPYARSIIDVSYKCMILTSSSVLQQMIDPTSSVTSLFVGSNLSNINTVKNTTNTNSNRRWLNQSVCIRANAIDTYRQVIILFGITDVTAIKDGSTTTASSTSQRTASQRVLNDVRVRKCNTENAVAIVIGCIIEQLSSDPSSTTSTHHASYEKYDNNSPIDDWGTMNDKIMLTSIAFQCLASFVRIGGEYIQLQTRLLIDSVITKYLQLISVVQVNHPILSHPDTIQSLFDSGIVSLCTPYNDGSVSTVYHALVLASKACMNNPNSNIVSIAGTASNICQTICSPRAPAFQIVVRYNNSSNSTSDINSIPHHSTVTLPGMASSSHSNDTYMTNESSFATALHKIKQEVNDLTKKKHSEISKVTINSQRVDGMVQLTKFNHVETNTAKNCNKSIVTTADVGLSAADASIPIKSSTDKQNDMQNSIAALPVKMLQQSLPVHGTMTSVVSNKHYDDTTDNVQLNLGTTIIIKNNNDVDLALNKSNNLVDNINNNKNNNDDDDDDDDDAMPMIVDCGPDDADDAVD